MDILPGWETPEGRRATTAVAAQSWQVLVWVATRRGALKLHGAGCADAPASPACCAVSYPSGSTVPKSAGRTRDLSVCWNRVCSAPRWPRLDAGSDHRNSSTCKHAMTIDQLSNQQESVEHSNF